MLFNSFHFLVFFVLVTTLYFALNGKYRWALLLIASCYFYMVFVPVYILILGVTIVVDFFAGIWIERAQGRKRKIFLMYSLLANIGVLAVFKYYNFLNENLTGFLGAFNVQNHVPYLDIILPIGLSFHTFQAMSYTIEVYRGNQKAERHFGIYSLYVMFYPQLVAGPIERPQNLLSQFHCTHNFDYQKVTSGIRLIAWGLVKKSVVADRLSVLVDYVFEKPESHNGFTLWVGAIFFTFQIYCDFSGYSDMAIGAARVMGFDLMINFKTPYFSKSISEFWKRWHISLSTWFKDYLYIPLGGNRVKSSRVYLNLLIVFLVSGLWHGANWTYVIWGAIHGFYLVFSLWTSEIRKKAVNRMKVLNSSLLNISLTIFLVVVAWVFFRAETPFKAYNYLRGMFLGWGDVARAIMNGNSFFEYMGVTPKELWLSGLFIVLLYMVEWLNDNFPLLELFMKLPVPIRWSLYYALIAIIIHFGVFEDRQFIYFQF